MAEPATSSVRNLYKIFGADADRLYRRRSRRGMTKTELNDKHGHVLGLKDINIDMPGGEHHRGHGPVGLRQVDADPPHQPADRPTAGEVSSTATTSCKMTDSDLREFRRHKTAMVFQKFAPAAAPDGARKRRLRPRHPGHVDDASSARAGHALDRARRPRRLREQLSQPALGRHAAARRPCAGADQRCRHPADGRGLLGARPADPHRHADRAARPAEGTQARPSSSSPTISTRRCGSATRSPSCATAKSIQQGTRPGDRAAPGRRLHRQLRARRSIAAG